jgi:predicted nucleic acid-binding protein
MSNIFFDTNILVYSIDNDEPGKKKTSIDLLEKHSKENDRAIISTQNLNEFISPTTKKRKLYFENAQFFILKFIESFKVVNVITPTILSAFTLKAKYNFSYWDSLIIATALENDCDIIYSEDMQHGLIVENKLKILTHFIE